MDRPAAKQRPKAPLYPRPIPDFVVEELPPGPEDTAWDVVHPRSKQSEPNDNASNDPEAEQRAAKRRRIEACATAYLRGESLYIMTAQLKGPFEDGWRNPWARKRKHTTSKPIEEGVSVEIPETAKKVLSSFTQEKANVVPVTTPESRPASRSSVHRRPGLRSAPVDQAPSPFTSKVQKLLPVPSPQVPTEVKENRVKEWLRTNETYGSPSEVLVHSSPTPATRKRQVSGNAQHEGGLLRASQSDPVRTNSRNKTLNDSVLVQDRNTSRLSEAGAMLQKLSKDIQTIVSEPTSKPTADLEDEVRKLTNCEEIPAKLSDDSRAEFAINKAKLSALQSVPAVAHMSPFEFRKVPGKNNKIGNDFDAISGSDNIAVEPVTNTASAVMANMHGPSPSNDAPQQIDTGPSGHRSSKDVYLESFPPAANQGTAENLLTDLNSSSNPHGGEQQAEASANHASHPTFTNQASDLSTMNMLPSAQPRPEPLRHFSSVTHDDRMQSMKQITNTSHVVNDERSNTNREQTAARILQGNDTSGGNEPNNDHIQDREPSISNEILHTPFSAHVAELDTQEMLANIEPVNLSTIKKTNLSAKKETPGTAVKVKQDRKRKKTSFAMEPSSISSFGSIQGAMKAKVSKSLGSPPSFALNKGNLDIDRSDEENESPRKRSRQLFNVGKPKGILKSTNPASSPESQRKIMDSMLLTQDQNDQLSSFLPSASAQKVFEEDHFDLDAAIDDLGSFLGTWDAEKEASSLDIEL